MLEFVVSYILNESSLHALFSMYESAKLSKCKNTVRFYFFYSVNDIQREVLSSKDFFKLSNKYYK